MKFKKLLIVCWGTLDSLRFHLIKLQTGSTHFFYLQEPIMISLRKFITFSVLGLGLSLTQNNVALGMKNGLESIKAMEQNFKDRGLRDWNKDKSEVKYQLLDLFVDYNPYLFEKLATNPDNNVHVVTCLQEAIITFNTTFITFATIFHCPNSIHPLAHKDQLLQTIVDYVRPEVYSTIIGVFMLWSLQPTDNVTVHCHHNWRERPI